MNASQYQLDLPALDGANPLGFLAALGTLAVLSEADPALLLGWRRGPRWTASLQSTPPLDADPVLEKLVALLKPSLTDLEADQELKTRRNAYFQVLAQLEKAQSQPKLPPNAEKRLREERKQRLKTLEQECSDLREAYKAALEKSPPSPELRLGKLARCAPESFRGLARSSLSKCSLRQRRVADLLAAFGIEQSQEPGGARGERPVIQRTPFCFTTGSGHQEFSGDVRQLMTSPDPTKEDPNPEPCISAAAVKQALFGPWAYSDAGLSMRWDPVEDTRYALRFDDPSSAGVTTVWMANLLAYRALVLFPCVATARGLAQAGWSGEGQPDAFTWPIWQEPLSLDAIRSLLWHPAFGDSNPAQWRQELRARGVLTVYRSRRIQVGTGTNKKINFSPAVTLF